MTSALPTSLEVSPRLANSLSRRSRRLRTGGYFCEPPRRRPSSTAEAGTLSEPPSPLPKRSFLVTQRRGALLAGPRVWTFPGSPGVYGCPGVKNRVVSLPTFPARIRRRKRMPNQRLPGGSDGAAWAIIPCFQSEHSDQQLNGFIAA